MPKSYSACCHPSASPARVGEGFDAMVDGTRGGIGWLFALADKQRSATIGLKHNDPTHRWTMQNLADHVNMSRSALAFKFKQTIGVSPMDYLTVGGCSWLAIG